MSEPALISVSICLTQDRRALKASVSSQGKAFDVLSHEKSSPDSESILIHASELSDPKRAQPGTAMTRHLVEQIAGVEHLEFCDNGEIILRFKEKLTDQQIDQTAAIIAKHLVVMIPLSVLIALQ